VRRVTRVLAVLALLGCGRKALPVAPERVRPQPPDQLAASATREGVRLTWLRPLRYSGGQRMNDLGGFMIERAPGEGGPAQFAQVGTLTLEDRTRFRKERHLEWTDRDAAAGARYLYRVIAVTLDGYRSAAAGPVAIRYGPPAGPEPPPKPGQGKPR